jgi:hypothetical protein
MRGLVVSCVLLLTLGVWSCDESSPTQPTFPSVSGRWEGGFEIVGCVADPNCIPSPCRFILGNRSTLRLSLGQFHAELSGPLELYLDDPFFVRTGEVRGTVDQAGRLSLSGTIPEVDRQTGRIERFLDVTWNTVLETGGARMTGGFTYHTRNASGTGCTTTETATTPALVRAQ